jgi:hypothetical protein
MKEPTSTVANKNGYDSYRMATGRLVFQLNLHPADDEATNAVVITGHVSETEIEMSRVWGLRPLGPVTARAHTEFAEFAVEVEFGPATGPLDRSLSSALRELVGHRMDLRATEVFAFQQRDATQGELQTELARLEAAADDLDVPLARRRELSDRARELRKRAGVVGSDVREHELV